jgi:hypothetical protein
MAVSCVVLFLGILFHWLMCLFLYKYHVVFVTMASLYNLRSEIVIPLLLLSLLTITLAIWGSFLLPYGFLECLFLFL